MKAACPDSNCKGQLKEVRKTFDPKRAERFRKNSHESTHGDFFYDYPKDIVEPGLKGVYYEYRFVCKNEA
jgi:hypothetical protein